MIIKVDDEIALRSLQESDAEDIFYTIDSQRKYLGEWLPFVEYSTEVGGTRRYIEKKMLDAKEGTNIFFTIRKNDVFAGMIGLKNIDMMNQKAEIGYWLSEIFQKQAIMVKSVRTLCQYAFETLGMNRIMIKCAMYNVRSHNIPLKLGFKFEGVERQGELFSQNRFVDLEIFSKLKDESFEYEII